MDTADYELVSCEEDDALRKQIVLLERHIESCNVARVKPEIKSNFRKKNVEKRSEKSAHRILWR